MPKRLFTILVTGGALACCIAPPFLFAEDGSPQWQVGPGGGRVAVFLGGKLDAPVVQPQPPANPESAKVAAPDDDSGSSPYRTLIESISSKNGVDPDLIDAM